MLITKTIPLFQLLFNQLYAPNSNIISIPTHFPHIKIPINPSIIVASAGMPKHAKSTPYCHLFPWIFQISDNYLFGFFRFWSFYLFGFFRFINFVPKKQSIICILIGL